MDNLFEDILPQVNEKDNTPTIKLEKLDSPNKRKLSAIKT